MAFIDYEAALVMLENLKTKAAEFINAFQTLQSIAPKTAEVPELEAERQRLLGTAGAIKSTIDSITSKIDATISWAKRALGWEVDSNVGNLEALPILAMATVGVVVAGITKWLTDYMTFMKKYDAYENLTAQGVQPGQAWKMAMNAGKVSLIGQLTKAFIPLLLIGGAFYLLPKFAPNLRIFGR